MSQADCILRGRCVLLGVSGGIAAYKAVDLASKLAQSGAKVHTILTTHALEFVQPLSFEAVTHGPVFTSMWKNPQQYAISHIHLTDEAEIVVVAPATANILAKAAHGLCDDLLSTVLCACWKKPVLFAPAMNDRMWTNPAVVCNVKRLGEMGYEFVGPETGALACGTEGTGRMTEPQQIADTVKRLLG